MHEQFWGFPPLQVTDGYSHCLQTAMAFVEADHRVVIAASIPFELKLLEVEWGWWWLPNQEKRVKAARETWKNKRDVTAAGVLPSATIFDDF